MRRLVIILAACVLLPATLWAQSGKLAGTVTDAATGDPIPGATVVLEGTTLGTATDAQGDYFIIGIQPGTYSVRYSFVGYSTKIVENVLVTSDRTKTLDVTLESEVVEGSEVVVEAVRPVVDPNQTTSRALVTSDEISRLPVRNISDVLSATSNSYQGYLRGSRRFETKTILEGIDISDAFFAVASATDGYVGGNVYQNANKSDKTSATLFDINPESVSEVAVNTGATEAQYASATGGVVTVSLEEGRGPLRGSFSARISPGNPTPGPDSLSFYEEVLESGLTVEESFIEAREAVRATAAGPDGVLNTDDDNVLQRTKLGLYTWDWDKYCDSGGSPGDRDGCDAGMEPELDFRGSLGGSITDNWHFSANVRYFESTGFMPNQFDRKVTGQLKTTYEISGQTSLTAVGVFEDRGYWFDWNNTDYQDLYRFNLESVSQNDGGSYLGSLRLRQVINEHSFVTFQVYRTYWRDRYGYPDDDGDGIIEQGEDGDFIDFFDLADNDGNGYPDVTERYIDVTNSHDSFFGDQIADPFADSGVFLPNGLRYRIGEPLLYSEDTKSTVNAFKVDYSNQINPNHFIQAGGEAKFRNITNEEAYGVDGLGFTLNGDISVGGQTFALEPYIPRGYDRSPKEYSLYASDRMEYAGLVINLGLRLDAYDRDMQEVTDAFFPFRQDTIVVDGFDLARNNWRRGDDVGVDVVLNPSIGVSHPIGTTASMYFSYKRANQLIPYSDLYFLSDGNHSTSRFFNYTDPNIDLVKSDNYELGVQWEFLPGWGADVNAYMRAIENYGAASIIARNRVPEGENSLAGMTQYTYRTDFGYADSRGIEFTLRRAPIELTEGVVFGITASYTFSTVEAAAQTGSNPNDFIAEDDADVDVPFDNAEDFRHFPVNVRGNSQISGGIDRRHRVVTRAYATFPYDISLGINANVASGFLYSPAIVQDERDRELDTGPTNYTVDLRLEKGFEFTDRFGLDLFLDVTNLFDRDNVIAYDTNENGPGPFVFQETGVPGIVLVDSQNGLPFYGPARTIYFGSRVRF